MLKIKKELSIILTFIMIFNIQINSVYANSITTEDNEKLKSNILSASELLSNVFEQNYETAIKETKKEIADNKYDYELTMESFYENGNPFSDADYISYIAGYIAAREMMPDTEKRLSNINFLKVSISENSIQEYEPIKQDKYIEKADNIYEKTGSFYIYEPLTINTYEGNDLEGYKITGQKEIIPKSKKTKYGIINMEIISINDLFSILNLNYDEKSKERVEQIIGILNSSIQNNNVSQNLMLKISLEESLSPEIVSLINNLKLDQSQFSLLQNAISLLGRVPYEWGGKASSGEYDTSWWSIGSSGKQKGLDCSGYVQWAFMAAGFEEKYTKKMSSTSEMLSQDFLTPCSYDELEPGDLGFFNNGETTNHVGIYLGNGYFIHCSSSKGTVVISQAPFKIYRKWCSNLKITKNIDLNSEIGVLCFLDSTQCELPSQEDIKLLAQTICAEAGGEGINGWIAVAEVVKNRKNSSLYPNTISENVLDKSQFSTANIIQTMNPSPEMLWVAQEVLKGNLSILETDVLYFRNCYMLNEDPISNWGTHEFSVKIGNHSFYKQ